MPHIHTEPGQHDFTTSAYIILINGPAPKILLHKHKKLGLWMQFGGHIELNENPWQALKHEILEESGYDLNQLKLLQPALRLTKVSDSTLHPYPVNINTHKFTNLDHYHTDIAYAFITSEKPGNKPQEGESSNIKPFTLKELNRLTSSEIPDNVKEAAQFIMEECLNSWEKVTPNL